MLVARRLFGLVLSIGLVHAGAAASAAGITSWDAVPYSPPNPIVMQGSLVIHDDGGDVRAFSSTAQRFAKIAPSGAPILGSGDRFVIVRIGNTYRAWSARTNTTAEFVQTAPLAYSAFGDDVALLVFGGGANGAIVYAYSAVTNQWKSISGPFAGTAASNAAVSRFVIAMRLTGGVHGFSARKGEWVLLPGSQGYAAPQADGNVAITTGVNPFTGMTIAAAFSGVLGTWSQSGSIIAGSEVKLDHNVAFARGYLGVGNDWSALGYSAYTGSFVLSTIQHPAALTYATYLSDNIIVVGNAGGATPGVEAFGARPGKAFAFLSTNTGGIYVPIGQDYMICKPSTSMNVVQVFSGLCGGSFSPYPFTATFSGGFAGVHQFVAVDTAGTFVGYSAATHTFSTMPLPISYDLVPKDAVAEMRQSLAAGARFHSFAARHAHFTSSANQEPGAMFATTSAGSLIARKQQNGAAAGGILVYDERGDRYPPLFQPGGPTTVVAGTNVLLVARDDAPHTVTGYSVARGDWSASPSSATGTPLVAPQCDDDVGYFVDSAGKLFAFGGDGDLHAFYSWPNETEYQTFGVAAGQFTSPPSPFSLAFGGEPGDLAFLLLSLGFKSPGLAVGGYQNPLCVDPATMTVLGPFGAIPSSRLLPFSTTGPTLGAPACLQLWMQCVLSGGPSGNWLGQRCEGVWFF